MLNGAILLSESIHASRRFRIVKRHINGVIIGQADGERSHVAITVDTMKSTLSLHPIIGQFTPAGVNWVFPEDPEAWSLPECLRDLPGWLRVLRVRPRLEWLRILKSHLGDQEYIKVAIEDYSVADVATLGQRGWFVGRSSHAPLWRIYALIPADDYDDELPALDGSMRSLDRFGAIYDPERHRIVLK